MKEKAIEGSLELSIENNEMTINLEAHSASLPIHNLGRNPA